MEHAAPTNMYEQFLLHNSSASQSSENGGDLVFDARKANTCAAWKAAARAQ